MEPSTHSTDPFSENDEAFFQAGVEAEREATSDRPVVLESNELPASKASRATVHDARRARLLRAVKTILAALCLLAVIGLARYALRPGITAVEEPTPGAVRAARASGAPNTKPAESPPLEVAADFVASYDDDSASVEASTCQPPTASETRIAAVTEHAAAKPQSHAPARRGATPVHRRANGAPVTKSALLRAIRAS